MKTLSGLCSHRAAGVRAARAAICLGLFALATAAEVHASVVAYSKVVTSASVSVNNYPGYQKIVVCSAGPFTVQAGDLATAHIQEEMTWTGTTHVMAACGIVVATSPTAVDNTSPGYIGILSKFAGSNLDKTRETSEVLTRTGSYQFASGYASVYINSVAYASTLSAGPEPDFVIPAGYAEIAAAIERGVTRYSTTAYQQLPYDSTAGNYYVPIATTFTPIVQYACGPIDVPANTMVDVRYQIEATTQTTAQTLTQRLGRKIIQTTSPTTNSGTNLLNPIQGGATGFEHHMTYATAGGMYFPSAVTGNYFNSVLWAYGGGTEFFVETDSSILYGGYAVELRPYAGFWRDTTRQVATLDSTERVLYVVGPIDVPANQLVEIRYQAAFQPSANVAFDSMIVRGTSPTDALGTQIQRPLQRHYDPAYTYTNAVHSTAERPTTAATGQYYKVIAWLPSGGTLPVLDWGQLEVVFR